MTKGAAAIRAVLAGVLMSGSFASAALAQAGDVAGAATAAEDQGEIVVTAQLRAQNPIEVPIALSVLGGDTLDRLGFVEFDDLSRYVPGFVVQNQSPNGPGFVMRGITSDSGAAYNEPRVSIYQDGVSISKSRGSYVELFDVSRVEIAKGPQSTLYGRGALIGAVNIIQNKADPRGAEGFARASYGNYNAYMLEAMANAPLADGVALRLAGRVRERDGFIGNLLGGKALGAVDTRAVRGSLHAETGGLKLDLIGNYQRDRHPGTAFKSIAFRPTDPATGAVIGDAGRNSAGAFAAGAGFEGDHGLGLRRKVWGVTGIADYAIDDRFTLTAISAYRRFDAFEIFDGDGLSLPILTAAEDAKGRQASQDLRLTYEAGPLTAFLGASYFHENGSQRTPAQFDEREVLARLAGQLAGPIPGRPATDPAPSAIFANTAFTGALVRGAAAANGVLLPAMQAQAIAANLQPDHRETSTNFSRTNAADLFADVTYRVSERFEIGGGIRYSHDDKRTRYTAAVRNGRSILGGFLGALGQAEPVRSALLGALAAPGAAVIPPSAAFPLPLFGLGMQPTAGNGGTDTARLTDDGFSFRATARYTPDAGTSLYATYARGRRPKVLAAAGPPAPFAATRFDILPNETVDSYEVGAKTALLDRRLFVDGALFLYDYSNFQTIVQQGTQFVTTNAGKARSYGFEGQARYVASRDLTVLATYAYNHSRFRSGLRDGNRFRLSPDHAASLAIIGAVPLAAGRITLTPSVTWQSRIYFDDDNDRPDLQQPPAALVADTVRDETQGSYALANARIGYEPDGAAWRIEAFVENAFDRKYVKDAGNTGDALGLPTFIAGEPRFYGVTASIRLGG